MIRQTLIAAAAVAATLAGSAQADAGRAIPSRAVITRTAMDGSTVCLRTAESAGCASYQATLLRTVGQKAAASRTNISVNDLGRRQLSALIASIN